MLGVKGLFLSPDKVFLTSQRQLDKDVLQVRIEIIFDVDGASVLRPAALANVCLYLLAVE